MHENNEIHENTSNPISNNTQHKQGSSSTAHSASSSSSTMMMGTSASSSQCNGFDISSYERYSAFCGDCGVDVFRFCHEHWCKNFD
ncbi:predicted protein [Lichtheimia corymbifera JMRC:FSU:9682]|uniref:Uncharacterized protein n=1 Tax=Lichtheimia corymbifera JMRC:FSU:9682 TaxID=1263082 RepID=A0A068RMA9_9FUNG|nr:predicted protein [Lichtheimia corymbifera JMRC:FSU:9682]